MQESRLFRIIYYLIEKGKSTAPKLAEKFEVSVRTIYRDIDVISSAGVPIYVTTGRNGGIQIADDYVIDRVLLSDKEKEDILTALKSVSIVDDHQETLSKLSAIFNTTNENWLEVDFSRWGNKSQDNRLFQILKKAIISHKVVDMTYANSRGEINERMICPLKLVYKAKEWYIKAYCLNKSAFRIFKLTRIIQAKELEKKFNPLEFPQEETEKQQVHDQRVTLRFPKTMAYRIYDEFEIDEIHPCDHGDFIVSARMPIDDWLIGYLLSFGSNVHILEPEYLKKSVWSEAKKIYEHHKP